MCGSHSFELTKRRESRGQRPVAAAGRRRAMSAAILCAFLTAPIVQAGTSLGNEGSPAGGPASDLNAPGRGMVTATFEQVQQDGKSAKGGTLYLDRDGSWRLDYEWPLRQSVIADDSAAVVLYPDAKIAVWIETSHLEPPSHLFFLAHARASFRDLAATGLRMEDFTVAGDSTVTVWRPVSCEEGEDCGRIRIHHVDDQVVRLEALSPAGHHRSFRVTRYAGDGAARLPSEIVIKQDHGEGEEVEIVRYHDIAIEHLPQAEIFSTNVPSGYTIEKRSW